MSDNKGPDITKAGVYLTVGGCAMTLLSPFIILAIILLLGLYGKMMGY